MDKKSYQVIVSSRAEAMLLRHVAFMARVSVPAADKLAAAYRKSIAELKKNPQRFPFLEVESIPPHLYRKCLFYGRYELIFLIVDTTVYIDAVRDCRQDPDSLPS